MPHRHYYYMYAATLHGALVSGQRFTARTTVQELPGRVPLKLRCKLLQATVYVSAHALPPDGYGMSIDEWELCAVGNDAQKGRSFASSSVNCTYVLAVKRELEVDVQGTRLCKSVYIVCRRTRYPYP